MATTESSRGAGKWETVKGRKGDRKKKVEDIPEAKPKATKQSAPAPPALTASNTFDALSEKEQKVPSGDTDQRRRKSAASDVQTPGTPPQSQEQNLPPFTFEDGQKESKEKREKKEKKAKKKPGKKQAKAGKSSKPTAPLPSGMSTPDLRAVLQDVEKRYPKNEAAQLEYIADAFLAFYKEASIGFPGDVRKKPHQQTVHLADGFLTETAAEELGAFLEKKSPAGLSEGLAVLLRALFDASDDTNASRGQVGLVLLVSVAARSNPVAVVRCMEELVYEGARFTSADRIPLLLWVFGQAERGAHGAFLACWMRILLPQLVGSPTQNQATIKGKGKKKQGALYTLDSKASQQAALALDRALNGGSSTFGISSAVQKAGKAGLKCRENSSEVQEPIVSLVAFDQILTLLHNPGTTPAQITKALEALCPSFRKYAFSLASPTSLHSFVPKTLHFAGKSDGGYMGPGDRIVAEAARNLMTCLEEDIECFEVWTINHKKHIKGSCRILQHLLHKPPREFLELMKSPALKESFLGTMKKLQERHGFLLAQDKGWQAACAKGAHEASKKFLDGSVKSVRGSRGISTRALFMSCIVAGILSAVVASKWDDIEDYMSALKSTEAWQKVEELLQSESMKDVLATMEMAKSHAQQAIEDFKGRVLSFVN